MTNDDLHFDKALQTLALIELTMKAEFLADAPERIEALWPNVDDLNEMFTMLLTFAAATVMAVDHHMGTAPDGTGDYESRYVGDMREMILYGYGMSS